MITFKVRMSIYLLCLLVFLIPANYILLPTVTAATVEVYPKGSTPLVPYDTWKLSGIGMQLF